MTTVQELEQVLEQTREEIPRVLLSGAFVALLFLGAAAAGVWYIVECAADFGRVSSSYRRAGSPIDAAAIIVAVGIGAGGFLCYHLTRHARDLVRYRLRYGNLQLEADELHAATLLLNVLPIRQSAVPARIAASPERVERIVRRLHVAGIVEEDEEGRIARGGTRVRDRSSVLVRRR